MIGAPLRGDEMARLGIINYATKREDLDAKVNELVQKLLAKPAHTLARTKRVINRPVVNALANSLDAGIGYEIVDFLQWGHDHQTQKKSLLE